MLNGKHGEIFGLILMHPFFGVNAVKLRADTQVSLNAIKLSPGEHAGSPLRNPTYYGDVGADLRVCP